MEPSFSTLLRCICRNWGNFKQALTLHSKWKTAFGIRLLFRTWNTFVRQNMFNIYTLGKTNRVAHISDRKYCHSLILRIKVVIMTRLRFSPSIFAALCKSRVCSKKLGSWLCHPPSSVGMACSELPPSPKDKFSLPDSSFRSTLDFHRAANMDGENFSLIMTGILELWLVRPKC